jgi:hypothetical protein
VAWDQWNHRNSILHGLDSTKQHKLITQDTDRRIIRQFAMGVQGLPSKYHYLLQEPVEELLKAPLHVLKQWLASAQSTREREKRRVAEQAEKHPEKRQFMANWLHQGTYPAFSIFNRQFVIDDASFQPLRTDLGCHGRL